MTIIKFIGFLGLSYLFYFLFFKITSKIFKKEDFFQSLIIFILNILFLFFLSIIIGSYIQGIKYEFSSQSYILILQLLTLLLLTHVFNNEFNLKFLKIYVRMFLKISVIVLFILGMYISSLYIPFFENILNFILKIFHTPFIGFTLSIFGIFVYYIDKFFKKIKKSYYGK
jgi:hypothetical protein